MAGITVRQFEKVLVVGGYRMGKSSWCRWLLGKLPRTLAYDPVWEFPDHEAVHTVEEAERQFRDTGRSVMQPVDAQGEFRGWLRMVLQQRNAMVMVDEPTTALGENSAKAPLELGMLHRLGHKVGLGFMTATHRYRRDLPVLFRVHHHAVVFGNLSDADLDAVAGVIGEQGRAWVAGAPPFAYWYRGPSYNGPMPPLKLAPRSVAPGPKQPQQQHPAQQEG